MASPLKKRFTKAQISIMAEAIADQMHNNTLAELAQEHIRLSDLIYQDYYTDEEHKLIQSLPSGYLPTQRHITAYLVDDRGDGIELSQSVFNDPDSYRYRQANYCHRSTYSYDHVSLQFSKEVRLKFQDSCHGSFKVKGRTKLIKELIGCNDKTVDVKVQRMETIDQMEGMLGEFSNFEMLYEHWPAVREILRKYEPAPAVKKDQRTLPPATVFDDLNLKLGIPTEKVIVAT